MKSISTIRYILSAYSGQPLPVRLFIFVRYLVCPWDAILRRLEGKKNLLDIGCGHGLFLQLAKNRYPSLRCTGFDHDKGKINVAKRSLPQTEMVFLYDFQVEGLRPAGFDCIDITDVLYSVPQEKWPADIFKLIRKLLKPGGALIVKETVNRPKWKYILCALQELVAIKILRYTKGSSPRLFSIDFYLSTLREHGFEIVDHRRIDSGYPWPHYLFEARKPG